MTVEKVTVKQVDTLVPLYIKCEAGGDEVNYFVYMNYMTGDVFDMDIKPYPDEFAEAIRENLRTKKFKQFEVTIPDDIHSTIEEAQSNIPPATDEMRGFYNNGHEQDQSGSE